MKKAPSKSVHVSGKRKKAIARATLSEGKGVIRINHHLLEHYQPEMCRMKIQEPLILAGDVANHINIDVHEQGGGFSSQTEAARLAIARAIVQFSKDKQLRQKFLDYDRHLLVADTRFNEPHKPNDSKPRAARQKSYR